MKLRTSLRSLASSGVLCALPLTLLCTAGLNPAYGQAIGYARTLSSDGTVLDTANSFNPNGGITTTRNGVGDYTIQFQGPYPTRPAEQVAALGPDDEYCKIASSGGSPYFAKLRCFNMAGQPADTRYTFTLLQVNNPQQIGYSWVAGGNVQPDYSWSPAGNITASRTGVGTYTVTFPGMQTPDHVQVSAYGDNNTYCYPVGWSNSVQVRCVNPAFAAVDSDFNISYVRGSAQPRLGFMSAFGNDPNAAAYTANGAYRYNSSGGDVTVTRSGTGVYGVRFAGINPSPSAGSSSNALVVGYGGNSPLRCSIDTVNAQGADVVVNIACFGSTGAPANGLFNVLLLAPQQGAGCTYSFPFPTGATISWPAGGGPASILLQTQPGCPWTASSNAPWLTVNSANGSGQSQVLFTAQPNNTGAARTGTVVIAGTTINVSQDATPAPPGCTYSFPFPTGATISWPAGGGPASILLQTQAGCPWTASSNAPWLTVNSANGSGQSQVLFTAQPNNTGATRTGTVVIAGTTINVSQDSTPPAPGCTYSFLFPTGASVSWPAGGGPASILLQTQPGCPWTASSNAPWLTVNSSNGSGQSQVLFTAQPNNTGATRTGTVVIAGNTINVSQESTPPAPGCTYSFLFPTGATVSWPAGGGPASILLQTQPGCAWTASSNAPWLTVNSSNGSGQSQVLFTAQPNNTGATRTGTVVIAGTTINVSQDSQGGTNPSVTGFTPTPSAPQAGQSFSFVVTGANFDPASASVLFSSTAAGTACPTTTPCAATLTERVSNRITGSIILGAGTYSVAVANATGNPAAAGLVTVTDTPVTSINVTPASLQFQHRIGDAAPSPQTISIPGRALGFGGTVRPFTIDFPSVTWLSVNPASGQVTAGSTTPVTVTVSPSGVPAGTQVTALRIRFPGEGIVTDIPVSLTVQDGSPATVNTSQVLSHIADSAGWQTTIILLNVDTEAAPFSLRFYGSQATGRAPSAPLDMAFVGLAGRTSLIEGVIPAGGSRTIQTAGTDGFLNMGWAELVTTKRLVGSSVFRDTNGRQEAAVSLTGGMRSFLLPFDNTQGRVTSFALINNNATQPVSVNVALRDENGVSLGTTAIVLLPRGHTATETLNQFPASANQRGTVEFTTPNPDISGLGIRFDAPIPGAARPFTSFPVHPKP